MIDWNGLRKRCDYERDKSEVLCESKECVEKEKGLDSDSMDAAKESVTAVMLSRLSGDSDAFTVTSQSEIMEARSQISSTMSLLLSADRNRLRNLSGKEGREKKADRGAEILRVKQPVEARRCSE